MEKITNEKNHVYCIYIDRKTEKKTEKEFNTWNWWVVLIHIFQKKKKKKLTKKKRQ